jgi:hypothetical protein
VDRSLVRLAFLFLIGVTVRTHAEGASVTYSFFGSGFLEGTRFTYVSPSGYLTFPSGPLVPTTSTDLFFHDVAGADVPIDDGSIVDFDFVSEDEFVLHGKGFATTYDFTIENGFSFARLSGPSYSLSAGSSILAFGYLLNIDTNFDVVGAGGLGIRPTEVVVATPEPGSLPLITILAVSLLLVGRCGGKRREVFRDGRTEVWLRRFRE